MWKAKTKQSILAPCTTQLGLLKLPPDWIYLEASTPTDIAMENILHKLKKVNQFGVAKGIPVCYLLSNNME